MLKPLLVCMPVLLTAAGCAAPARVAETRDMPPRDVLEMLIDGRARSVTLAGTAIRELPAKVRIVPKPIEDQT